MYQGMNHKILEFCNVSEPNKDFFFIVRWLNFKDLRKFPFKCNNLIFTVISM